ncbi:MAG: hypothetical protein O7B30_07015 [Thaumarchaeota archaeon]|nr:hypothetical protein [Nitrososphaerota archaeon]
MKFENSMTASSPVRIAERVSDSSNLRPPEPGINEPARRVEMRNHETSAMEAIIPIATIRTT